MLLCTVINLYEGKSIKTSLSGILLNNLTKIFTFSCNALFWHVTKILLVSVHVKLDQ